MTTTEQNPSFKSGDILLRRNKFTMQTDYYLVIEEVYGKKLYRSGKGYKLWDFSHCEILTLALDSLTIREMELT